MFNFRINYEHPWLLLLIIPAIALSLLPYFLSDKKYRKTRNRIISVALHTTAMVLAVHLVAGITFTYDKVNEENEIVLLVDVSDSAEGDSEKRDAAVENILNIADGNYTVGIVKFAYGTVCAADMTRDVDEAFAAYKNSENPDTTATDIASAVRYAHGMFKNPESAKIVIISDGVETDENALSVIKNVAADGIRVDTVCLNGTDTAEMQISDIIIPEGKVTLDEPVYMELLISHNLSETDKSVTLRLFDNGEQLGEDATVTVNKKTSTLPVTVTLEERGMHELKFEIEYEGDTEVKNNSYITYINLEILDKVLLIEKYENEAAALKDILKDSFKLTDISIESDSAEMPKTLEDFAKYEQIILVNIAYSDMPEGFEENLYEYVHTLGGGLFTVGGENEYIGGKPIPHAYNRNDIESSTYYKEMLPVNVIDYTPPIAVMIVVDTSASMAEDGRLAAAVKGAEACLDALNDRDFCGVMSFESQASEKLRVLPVSQKDKILSAIRDIGGETAEGGTIFADAIMRAGSALSLVEEAERKHIILVSDGRVSDDFEDYKNLIEYNRKNEITMSVVALNATSQYINQLQNTADAGGGKFYNVPQDDMDDLHKTMTNDLAMNAVGEIEYGEDCILRFKDRSPVTSGMNAEDLPAITGYYGTLLKENAIAPVMGNFVPIYAEWEFGEGKVGSFLSDLNGIWSEKLVTDDEGKILVKNIVSHLFPYEDVKLKTVDYTVKRDNYTTTVNAKSRTEGNSVMLTVEPVSRDLADTLGNIRVHSAEAGRRFTFEIKTQGLYKITITELDSEGMVLYDTVTYTTFSYSEEYDRFTDRAPIKEELLTLIAEDGCGRAVDDVADIFSTFNELERKTIDPRTPLLILCIVLFLLDIAVRKFKFKWIWEIIREKKDKKSDNG